MANGKWEFIFRDSVDHIDLPKAFPSAYIIILAPPQEDCRPLFCSLANSYLSDICNYVVYSTEKASLYYICGYVARKEGIVCDDKPSESLPESEFTEKLSRGGLSFPPIDLYDLSLYCYAFFKSKSVKCCTKIFLEAFNEIHDFTGYDFPNIVSINRRLCNCFFKAFVIKTSDQINREKKKDQRGTKRRRVTSDKL